mgnify:CR=1 FL=1
MQYETHDDPDDFEVRWKVIDAFGNELLPALYDLVLGFRGGLAYAKTSEGNECIEGYIDITGKWVFQQRRPKPCR